MKSNNQFSIEELAKATNEFREGMKGADLYIPDKNDHRIPESIFKHNVAIWEEDPGVWHSLFGSIGASGVWAMGTTPLEAMIEFDKEFQLACKTGLCKPLPESVRKKIHKEAWDKIDEKLDLPKSK